MLSARTKNKKKKKKFKTISSLSEHYISDHGNQCYGKQEPETILESVDRFMVAKVALKYINIEGVLVFCFFDIQ